MKTRCYQVAHKIVDLAKKFDACIVIEDLTALKNARGNRKSNRKTKRMPYHKFREAIESVAAQEGIVVLLGDPRDTSKTCYKCGEIGSRNGAYFKCPNCGHQANADRNASVNVALRAGVTQTPEGNQTVNSGVFVHDGFGEMSATCFQASTQAPSS